LLLLLRSLPYHASRSHHDSYIPIEVASKHSLLVKEGGRSYIQLDSNEVNLSDALFEIASVANAHLQKARDLAGTVPVEARPVLLQSVPTQVMLDSLSKV
ncbi:NADH dehydrogenase (ubiquinone) complex I, assembly factor 6, partial [Linum perenne]